MSAELITIDFPAADVAALRRAMKRNQRELKKSLPQAVKFAAGAVAGAMSASTKVAPKRRPYEKLKTGRRPPQKKYGVESYKTGKKETSEYYAVGVRELHQSKVTTIANRGLAKGSWFWGLRALRQTTAGTTAGITKTAKNRAKRHVSVDLNLRSDNPTIVIRNKLPYIMDALRNGPQDVATAMRRAADRMHHIMDARLARMARGK